MTISDLAVGDAVLDSSAGLLAEVRASRRRVAAEEVLQLRLALRYAASNSPDSIHPAASMPGSEGELSIAGQGAPGIAEFAVVEFAAACGLSADAGRDYLGQVLELAYRLPATLERVLAGEVPVWRARRIAQHTVTLPPDGAAWVDAQVAAVAERVGPITLDRLVADAIVRFDPETAAQRALEDLETRHARVTLNHVPDGIVATGRLDAVVDAADALELDTILAQIAASLAAAGDTDPLDVRRAKALGLLARGELPELPDQPDQPDQPDRPAATTSGRRRQLVLHVSLTDTALHGCGDGIATLTTPTGRPLGPVTVEQVQAWCGTPGAQITVRPVIDLLALLTSTGYQPSPTLRDQTVALHRTCAFPHCDRPAESLDLDHIDPHATGGATSSDNLAPLCRRHHRTKTHTAWTYTRLGPAEHLWTSPHGHQFLKDRHTTRDVSPDLCDTG